MTKRSISISGMNKINISLDPPSKERIASYKSTSTEELISEIRERKGVSPCHLTATQVVEENWQRLEDCLQLGTTLVQAAEVIAQDPRCTVSEATLRRKINEMHGPWRPKKARPHTNIERARVEPPSVDNISFPSLIDDRSGEGGSSK